ncbi:MAG: 3-deoxy-7-phosphoheptulonate synthase [Verrucomicrobia bacterium]|nr:MAG: 3-deoxy-7-phosphoheptulonate synthase [Verrucomicrobiota bacterium]
MILVLQKSATEKQVEHILASARAWGLKANVSRGVERTIIGLIGDETEIRSKPLDMLPGVESVLAVLKPYKLAAAEARIGRTQIRLAPIKKGGRPVVIGGPEVVVMAGPCSIESREMLLDIARLVKKAGGKILRAGAFKPRTSPYSFQGMGYAGLRLLAEARAKVGIHVITEVMDVRDLEAVAAVADILQVGARNTQNFTLLKEIGKLHKPVMIKRGLANTIEELLMSAEYVMSEGNHEVILCERGIRTFEPMTRNTLDLAAVPVLKRESHLPVIADPSHGTGHWDLVVPMARAAVAAGADGVMVEIHPNPEEALSDGSQALLPKTFLRMMDELHRVAQVLGRKVG